MSKKVLVAEDNESIRELVKISLRSEGFELFEAADGDQAIDKAFKVMPDLVILDVMMPHKTGYEVCEILKNGPETKGARIMFLTSRTGAPAETAMRAAGCDDILTKPFKPADLREKVRSLLAAPPMREKAAGD